MEGANIPRDSNPPPARPPPTTMSTQIFEVNPYENHPELTQTESEVLWEYAKLNQRLKIVSVLAVRLTRLPSEPSSFTR